MTREVAKKRETGKKNVLNSRPWYSLRVVPALPDSVVCKCHGTQQSERLSFSVRLTGHDRSQGAFLCRVGVNMDPVGFLHT